MAASFLRASVLAVMISNVAGFAIGEFPTQTLGRLGLPFLPAVTEAPQRELVKARLEKKAVINTCTEWTIPGGFGQPECSASATCLFTSDGDYFYEGCGETSVSYDWITRCWNYGAGPLSTAPASEIYCSASEPECGYFAFVFAPGATFSNFGCSTQAYELMVELLDTTSSSVFLAGGGTSQVVVTPSTVYITPNPTVTVAPTGQNSGSTSLPSVGSHKKKKKSNVGAIAGGIVGGLLVLAALAIVAFFLIRKKRAARQDNSPQSQHQQANVALGTAWNNPNQPPEIDGKPGQQIVYAPAPVEYPQNEKPMAVQEAYRPPPQTNLSNELGTPQAPQQSPPPVYAQPSPSTRQPSNFTELDPNIRTHSAGPPVSPIGTLPPASSELGDSRIGSPVPQHAELGGQNGGSYQVPSNVQEMGASSGGITRAPGAQQQRPATMDMSGAPMSDEYHHELP